MIRYEFYDASIKEEDIHPETIYNKELNLAEELARKSTPTGEIQPCPICGSSRTEILFKKWGHQYAICPAYWSISIASMPKEDQLFHYFHDSKLSRFRASKEVQDITTKNRKELWEGQFEWIEGRISRYMGNDKYNVVDWGSKSTGWIDCLRSAGFVKNVYAVETLPPITDNERLDEPADIILLVDALQRQHDPLQLFNRIVSRIKRGGLLCITCRAGTGLDILSLKSASESIFAFDHLILPSPEEIKFLLEKTGFEVLEVTTPGLLDMEYIKKSKSIIPHDQHFLRYILNRNDEDLLHRMQLFLQRNNLSSHLRCIAKKK
jgi:hypothetical protein